MSSTQYDAVIVGSGPNGLTAAVKLAQAGRSVLLLEAKDTIGGGLRSAELTLPGYIHDVCSAIHPLALLSPYISTLPLREHGLEWLFPAVELAHPLDNEPAILVKRSIKETAQSFGADAATYRRLLSPLVSGYKGLMHEFLGPLRFPRYPFHLAYFGLQALFPASWYAKLFRDKRTRAMFAGMAAHSIMPLENLTTAAFGLMLTLSAHAVGWPVVKGGSQKLADALTSYLKSLGGKIEVGHPVSSFKELPPSRAVIFDVAPRSLLQIVGDRFPAGYRSQLEHYRYGPGVFKVDYALDGPIPWRDPDCNQSATVHIGGTFEEIALSERESFKGKISEKPFILLAQQSLIDPSRAPEGKHTIWAYCHVPNGSTVDMTERIEAQIERFAPGFRDRILARTTRNAAEVERYNPNYVGGDIAGGVQDIFQLYTRPARRLVPYTTPLKNVFICSASTPPGGGVHGMCGYFAADAALKSVLQ